jgi:hypothetical protein
LLAVPALSCAVAFADKKSSAERARIEADLEIALASKGATRIRPGDLLEVEARMRNRSADTTHKVIEPGSGSSFGIVEPHVTWSATYVPHEGETETIRQPAFEGMCGMGDYRWHRLVRDLAPGETLDVGQRAGSPTGSLDMKRPGRYLVRLHYAWRRRGTTEKLPQADPVGDLGPMEGVPAFEIVSAPLRLDVVRPFEVFVDVRGKLAKGATRRLSELLTVRVENWARQPLTISNSRLKVRVVLRPSKASAGLCREPMAYPAIVLDKTLEPGGGFDVVGPAGGWMDEEWTPEVAGPVELHVFVSGQAPGAAPVRSLPVTLPGG